MEPSERVEEFIGPASIVSFPYLCKGNAVGRKMVLELVGGDKVDVLIPAPMDLVQSMSGHYLSTYNLETDVKGKIMDPKTAKKKNPKMIPGGLKARKNMIRGLLYKRSAEKPREFRVYKNQDGTYVLFGKRPYRSPA